LRLALVDDASAEGDHASARIADGEHEPIAKAVVMPLTVAHLARVALDDEPEIGELLHRGLVAAEASEHVVPGVERVADAEFLDRLFRESAFRGRVGPHARVSLELSLPVARDACHEVVRALVDAPDGGTAVAAFARNFETETPGEIFDRLGERHPVVIHQESQHGAALTAAEAVIELFLRDHMERRCFLVVERAARLVFAALLLERDARADDLDDVRASDEFINECLWNAPHGP